ncbi:mRNA deadenylase, exonuclease subunit and related nucleases [Balamuthia mandrillaris]
MQSTQHISSSSGSGQSKRLRVLSFNIRFDNPADGLNRWSHRRERVRNLIRWHRPHLLGLQEVLHSQLRDLAEALQGEGGGGPCYEWYGVGREDGQSKGEYCPIFYRKDRFELHQSEAGSFALSETPERIGSKSWNTACPRICSYVVLKDRKTGRLVLFFNTHLDHRSAQARCKGAELIVQTASGLYHNFHQRSPSSLPPVVIITGDMNVPEEDAVVQKVFCSSASSLSLVNARERSLWRHGCSGSFTGFDPQQRTIEEQGDEATNRRNLIDHIFVSNEEKELEGVKVLSYAVLPDHYDGKYVSDHRPVAVDLLLSC